MLHSAKAQTEVNELVLGRTNDAFSTKENDRAASIDAPRSRTREDTLLLMQCCLQATATCPFCLSCIFLEFGRVGLAFKFVVRLVLG